MPAGVTMPIGVSAAGVSVTTGTMRRGRMGAGGAMSPSAMPPESAERHRDQANGAKGEGSEVEIHGIRRIEGSAGQPADVLTLSVPPGAQQPQTRNPGRRNCEKRYPSHNFTLRARRRATPI